MNRSESRRSDSGRLPESAHASQPWLIHQIAPDFRLLDVWALPTPGGADDFPRLVRQIATGDTSRELPAVVRALFAIRQKLGKLFGWDAPSSAVGSRVPSLRERLPADLASLPTGPRLEHLAFSPVYLTDNEWVAELANLTVHEVLHLGWVPNEAGGYRGQLAVLVKPNGLLGAAYLTALSPFRHLIVYTALIKAIGQSWRTG
jgi:Protein of unknown function (DUF2867)